LKERKKEKDNAETRSTTEDSQRREKQQEKSRFLAPQNRPERKKRASLGMTGGSSGRNWMVFDAVALSDALSEKRRQAAALHMRQA
jgi:hypothetical protein